MSQKAITDELEAIDQKFDDTDKEIEEIKGDIKDTNDTIGDLQDTVEVIRTEAPVSAHPAGFKPDIDLTPEITVDRAWRDHRERYP